LIVSAQPHFLATKASVGIRSRVEDAELLWREERAEAALLMALIAASATARRKYPECKDGEGFERLLLDARRWRLSLEFRETQVPVERLLWKWLRCELVHEAGLPVDIALAPVDGRGQLSARAGGAPDYELHLSEAWLHHVLDVVIYDPINRNLFPEGWRDPIA
jgi:hypothetical protein